MHYYSPPCGEVAIAAMAADTIRLIDTPLQGKVPTVRRVHGLGARWCADNGAFSDRWEEDRWWTWLQAQVPHADRCDFAVAPDVVADAAATYERSMPWLPRITALGFTTAYVAQDGITDPPWGAFGVLFLGGSTEWKLGTEARDLTARAVARGVPVHMGRVNSQRRFSYAQAIGCSSVDGTYLTNAPDRYLPEILGWVRSTGQRSLVDVDHLLGDLPVRVQDFSPLASRNPPDDHPALW